MEIADSEKRKGEKTKIMKKLLLILLYLPMIGFGQDGKSFFYTALESKFQTMIIESTPPSIIDGATSINGSIVLSDTLVTIIVGKNNANKQEIKTYIYDITEAYNTTKVSFKLKEKLTDIRTRLTYINTEINGENSSVFATESIDEFSNQVTKVSYILKQ